MTRILPRQSRQIPTGLFGYPLEVDLPRLGFRDLLRLTPASAGARPPVIFHARRNLDMCLGLILRWFFRRRLHLVFTSVAQRHHTAFTRFLYHRMDTLLSTSERSASYLRRRPDVIIPHGADTTIYQPPADRAAAWREGGLPGKYGIGIFGRVRPSKGLAEFVAALCSVLPDHPDFTAVIIGETTPKYLGFVQKLKRDIIRQGLASRFVWLGRLPFAEIPLWFQRMSLVAAVPHHEGFGLTCLEAMASGVPVVATRTGAFESIIREGVDGLLVPCRDSAALAEAFRQLLADPAGLARAGTAARQRILEAFTIEREADALVAAYRAMQQRHR